MNLPGGVQRHAVSATENLSKYLPPPAVEYCYYAQVFYSIMGSALGISIDLLGIGMLTLLAASCVMRFGWRLTIILRLIALPLACAASFLVVQVLVRDESLTSPASRDFVGWMLGLVVVQSLALRRGFLHRFAIATILIGLSMLPYMSAFINDQSRTGLVKGITVANPNDLGAWFGFCCVYLTILGVETRRNWIRVAAWVSGLGSLFVVGLTVSRAPLFAAAVCMLFALRRALKRGFFPVLSVGVVAWLVYGLRVFDRSAAMYAERGLEETGRFVIWPLAIDRFLQSPLTGVGVAHVQTLGISPHNAFIYIALASGVVPLVFFVAYWASLFIAAFRVDADSHGDAPFQLPLLLYAFLISTSLNAIFMVPWIMASLCAVSGTAFLVNARRIVTGRLRAGAAVRRPDLVTLAH